MQNVRVFRWAINSLLAVLLFLVIWWLLGSGTFSTILGSIGPKEAAQVGPAAAWRALIGGPGYGIFAALVTVAFVVSYYLAVHVIEPMVDKLATSLADMFGHKHGGLGAHG